jgi:3-methylfumaryl-CoA hydratase
MFSVYTQRKKVFFCYIKHSPSGRWRRFGAGQAGAGATYRRRCTVMTSAQSNLPGPQALAALREWVGRCETLTDTITAAPLLGLSATLDRDDPPPADGDVVPPLGHWLFFLPRHRHSELGPDGHARRGGFLPPVPLPRRMWAGGRLVWQPGNPLRVGDRVQRHSRIESVTHKRGRSGDLVFVLVRHAIHNTGGLALTEEHDIVYRAAAPSPGPGAEGDQPTVAPAHSVVAGDAAAWQRTVLADDVLLFRYSALTFNGHRIHYDRRYVTEVEGYAGLVVHGPLIATLLLDLVQRHAPQASVTRFAFTALHPTFDGHPIGLNAQPAADGRSVVVWACDHERRLTMRGEVHLA